MYYTEFFLSFHINTAVKIKLIVMLSDTVNIIASFPNQYCNCILKFRFCSIGT